MPSAVIKKVSKILNKPVSNIEKLWNKAKATCNNGKGKFGWGAIMTVFKNMLGKEAIRKLGWETTKACYCIVSKLDVKRDLNRRLR